MWLKKVIKIHDCFLTDVNMAMIAIGAFFGCFVLLVSNLSKQVKNNSGESIVVSRSSAKLSQNTQLNAIFEAPKIKWFLCYFIMKICVDF